MAPAGSFAATAAAGLLLLLPGLANAEGIFTLSCVSLTIQRSDPIVSPGEMSGHVHAVVGGTAFQQTMGLDTATNANATTCSQVLDNSNYWQPALYHQNENGTFSLLDFQGSAVYYLNRACNYSATATSCSDSSYPLPPPAGLRMLAGDPFRTTYNSSSFADKATSHVCLRDDDLGGETPALPTQSCARLRSEVFFPSCWDGVNLDSDDHRSHMAYPAVGDYNTGVCPESHPVAIISIFTEWFYDTSPYPDWQNLVYAQGDALGYGLHADFVNGWTNLTLLAEAFATCDGEQGLNDPNCSITGGVSQGAYARALEVAAPSEQVGLSGPLDELPGGNTVFGKRTVSATSSATAASSASASVSSSSAESASTTAAPTTTTAAASTASSLTQSTCRWVCE